MFGEILEVAGPEGADALGITPALFRKRLQHARSAIVSFTRTYCGLASDTAACACHMRVPAALRVGRIREEAMDFAGEASSYRETRLYVRRVDSRFDGSGRRSHEAVRRGMSVQPDASTISSIALTPEKSLFDESLEDPGDRRRD